MERIKTLDRYQQVLLLLLSLMLVVFCVIYCIVSSRVGYLYHDVVLVSGTENGNTVYSGKINGWKCRFTVTEDKTVTLQCGDRVYGPYTARKDPTAVPEDSVLSGDVGIEIRKGDEVFFRGAVYRSGDEMILFEEDGGIQLDIISSGGIMLDDEGNLIDRLEPSAWAIVELMKGPELTHKGQWGAWFGGVVLSVVMLLSMLFADEWFRFGLMFRVQNVDSVEPSDWELASRYIAWSITTIMVLVIYLIGLR